MTWKTIGRSMGASVVILALLAPLYLVGELANRVDRVTGVVSTLVDMSSVDDTWPRAQEVLRLENGLWCGSGWIASCEPVGAGYRILVVTAAHVAEDDPTVPSWVREEYWHPWTASAIEGQLTAGRFVASHPTRDIAIIEFFSTEPAPVHSFESYDPAYGETIAHSGYPACSDRLRTSQGLACHDGIGTFQAAPGCSGGPVFNREGTVIGVLVSGIGSGFDVLTFTGQYVPVAAFEYWLNSHLLTP